MIAINPGSTAAVAARPWAAAVADMAVLRARARIWQAALLRLISFTCGSLAIVNDIGFATSSFISERRIDAA